MHFKALRQRLDANLTATHRTNPVFPADYKGDDVVDTYLRGTYLKDLSSLRTRSRSPKTDGSRTPISWQAPATAKPRPAILHC